MAKFVIGHGVDNYIDKLNDALMNTDDVLGRAIYEGAKIVTDKVASNIASLPVSNNAKGSPTAQINTITSAQKSGLKEGLGIARKRNDSGFINVKVGEDGYNRTKSKKYPKGQPNAMIARSVESGTSFRAKNPFITKAVQATKAQAEEAMAKELDNQLEKYFK